MLPLAPRLRHRRSYLMAGSAMSPLACPKAPLKEGDMLEIERRFICRVSNEDELRTAPSSGIRQGYLTCSGPTVRIRRQDAAHIMTIKEGAGLVRREIEFPVPAGPGEELLEVAGDQIIEKRRYRIGRWEVDIFEGRLQGLVLAEVELTTETEPLPEVPGCIELIREVTEDRRFTNRALAALGDGEVRHLIERIERSCYSGDAAPPGRTV